MRNQTYRILSEGHAISNDTWQTGLNNNDLIIGPSGAGKTRGYVLPNILQCSESLVVADTKGSLIRQSGGILARNGYMVYEIRLTDCLSSPCGYNPLDCIRYDSDKGRYSEQDIISVSTCLVPVESAKDPFWDYAARTVLESLVAYVMECLPEHEHTLSSVVALCSEMGDPSFERLFMELGEVSPDSFAVNRYRLYKGMATAEKMYASIQGILAEKLSPMSFDGAKALFSNPHKPRLGSLGQEKSAVFLTISDTDRSLDRLSGLFYAQALQSLIASADQSPGHCLEVPVRLILDDFAANFCIPDFDKTVSIIRSRGISASIVLQSISQLESMYGHSRAMTIMNNCDHLLYLGGQDVETARYIAVKANKSVNTILDMPLDRAWLFARGQAPRLARKYGLESHRLYHALPECRHGLAAGAALEHEA